MKLKGAEELASRFDQLTLVTRARAIALVNKYSFELMNEAKKNCPVDMGQLRASIRPQFYSNGLTAEVSTNTGYGAFVEFGTGPLGRSTHKGVLPPGYVHGSRGHFPPLIRIKEWCARVRIDPRFAFVIARKIQRNGLKARPYMWPAMELIDPKFTQEIKTILPGG